MTKILVIDDDRIYLKVLEVLLKNSYPDYEISTAQSGSEGIEKAKKELPDIIILDVRMPDMDGYEVCKRLQSDEYTQPIPVIFLTAYETDSKDVIRGLESGALSFLSKPIDKDHFIAQVNVALRIKHAEDTLRESEEKFSKVFYANPAIAGLSDLTTGEYIEVNTSFYDKLGFTPQEVIGKRASEVVRLDFNFMDRVLANLKKDNYVENEEAVIYTKKGIPINVLISAIIIEIDGRKCNYTTAIDITDRKQAEEALWESEKRFRLLADNQSDVIWTRDLELKITYVSPSTFKQTGFTVAEKMIQPITEAYTAESVGVITRIFTEELKLEREGTADPDRSRIFDLESYRKDGSTFWIGLSVSFLRDKNRAAIGLIGVSRDITERKKTEEEMQKLAAVVKHSSELVNLSTLDGRMIFLNESGGKMLGIEPHEVENVNIMEVIPNHLIGLVEKELLPALIKGRTWKGDLQYRNMKTGKLTNVHAMTFTVKDPDTGEPQFLANVSLDITERKQAEEELKQKMKQLERFNKVAVDRELRMIEMKKEINELLRETGRAEKYKVPSKEKEVNSK